MITKSFFKTKHDRIAYFEYDQKDDTDILVFLNGLSDSIESWATIKNSFQEKHSILCIDLIGQGHAYEEEFKKRPNINYIISAEEQAEVVFEIFQHLELNSPVHLIGFSYGGGIAVRFATLYPQKIGQLFLFLPYTIRLDLAFPIQRAWAGQIGMLKNFNLFRPHIHLIGSSYQKMIRDYMNFRFSKQIPDHKRRQVSMDLTEGIMPFNAFDVFEKLPAKSVHLVTVEHDTLVPKSLYREIWSRLPEEKKRSWLNIKDGEHLIFEQAPLYCAQWIETGLSLKTTLSPRVFVGHSYRMEIKEITETIRTSQGP